MKQFPAESLYQAQHTTQPLYQAGLAAQFFTSRPNSTTPVTLFSTKALAKCTMLMGFRYLSTTSCSLHSAGTRKQVSYLYNTIMSSCYCYHLPTTCRGSKSLTNASTSFLRVEVGCVVTANSVMADPAGSG